MAEGNKLFDNDYIKAHLIPADIKLHVITGDKLKNINASSILSDIFALLASLAWGAFISFLIADKTGGTTITAGVELEVYKNVFLWAGITLTVIFVITKTNFFLQISGALKSKLEITAN